MKYCRACEKMRSSRDFDKDGRTSDNLAARCSTCVEAGTKLAEDDAPALETVDLEGVDLLVAGGPYYGKGSPPEGDFFDEARLRAIVAANVALADELKPANKIGHSKEQALAANSGYVVSDGEMPALGWIENVRYDEEAKRIRGDIRGVPKKFARLVEKGAWRTRSVEISKVTSQNGDAPTVYDEVVTGLAWLGAKAPAVRTLDDVYALFAADDDRRHAKQAASGRDRRAWRTLREEVIARDGKCVECGKKSKLSVHLRADAGGNHETATKRDLQTLCSSCHGAKDAPRSSMEIDEDGGLLLAEIWNERASMETLRRAVQGALRDSGLSGSGGSAGESGDYWVQDVDASGPRALVSSWIDSETWVIPFRLREDGSAELAPREEWKAAEQKWVETAAEYAGSILSAHASDLDRVASDRRVRRGNGDTKTRMPELNLNEEQVAALADELGVELEDGAELTPEQISEAVAAIKAKTVAEVAPETEEDGVTPVVSAEAKSFEDTEFQLDGQTVRGSDLLSMAAEGREAKETLRTRERDAEIQAAVKDGKISAEMVEPTTKLWDENEPYAREFLSSLQPREELVAIYGDDGDPSNADGGDAEDKLYEVWAARSGIPQEETV